MTKTTMVAGVGLLLAAGLGLTVFTARSKKTPKQEGVCARTRRIYADAESAQPRIKAKEEAEFFKCNWTTPQGLIEIEAERGNPKAIQWLEKWQATGKKPSWKVLKQGKWVDKWNEVGR